MLKESSEIRTFEELSLTKGFWRTVPWCFCKDRKESLYLFFRTSLLL